MDKPTVKLTDDNCVIVDLQTWTMALCIASAFDTPQGVVTTYHYKQILKLRDSLPTLHGRIQTFADRIRDLRK